MTLAFEDGTSAAGARVAVVGATGLVGREIVSLLAERSFSVVKLLLYASDRSAGEEIECGAATIPVERLPRQLPQVDIAFLCAGAEVSRRVAEDFAAEGATVIDLSSAYRAEESVPLVVAGWQASGPLGGGAILAVPDALTSLLAPPLRALAGLSRPKRVIATATISASALGRRSVQDLAEETIALLNARETGAEARREMPFSCVPETAAGGETERCGLSSGVERDLRRLLGLEIPVHVTAVRAPTFHGHGASVSVETEKALSLEELRARLREAPSILVGEPDAPPTSTRKAVGSDAIHVGGLRSDRSDPTWVHFWAAADNVRQGASLNAVAVAEAVLRARRQS